MGRPVRQPDASDAPPSPDPYAVRHAYRRHRARRIARHEKQRERRAAHFRFFAVVLLLLGLCAAFALTAWHEVQRLFGL
jgi:hypothetical protein